MRKRDGLKHSGFSIFRIQPRRHAKDGKLTLRGMNWETHAAVQAESTCFAHEVANNFVIPLQRRDLLPWEWRHVTDTMGYHRINRHICLGEIARAPFVLVAADEDVIRFERRRGKTRDILEMVEAKHIHINRMTRMKDLWWYSYDQTRYSLLKTMADMLFGPGLVKRVVSAIKFVILQLRVKNI